MNFLYVNNEKKQITDYEKIKKVLGLDKSVIIDSSLFPIIEQAENGCGLAMAELRDSFTEGKNGVSPNYILAKHYSRLCFELIKDFPEFFSNENYLFTLRADVQIDYNFKKIKEGNIGLLKAVRFMVAELPPDKWDYSLIDLVKRI